MATSHTREDEEDLVLLRRFARPEEDLRAYRQLRPWRGEYRFFRAGNVVCLEHYRGRRQLGKRRNDRDRRRTRAKALKVYLDTVIVSAAVVSDLPAGVMADVEKLVAAFTGGKIDVETSRLTWDEQDKAKGTIKSKLLAARERFPVVPDDTKLLGINTTYYEGGFMSARRLTGIMDEALYETFRAAGLEERDAQHLMYAVHDRCDRFVTTDSHFLKNRRPASEASSKGLLIRQPSELVSELKP
jgi:hypothetical protein